ncbi:MAG: TraM recognition domain-containing protein [Clostridia bacterium]|nr:TraM recognition domain-containing protein [Clostridia bacterium]
MKIIDKFLKMLKTDRNTFLTYILTLVTIYLTIDRIVEILLMIFTGIGCSYWGPIQYALAFACPIFAFLFSCSSKFADSEDTKLSFFHLYVISLYILILSMFNQAINSACWLALLSTPSYVKIATEYSSLIAPAFRSISLYLPLTTFYPLIKWFITFVDDSKDIRESIYEYGGINLSNKKNGFTGQFSCEVKICTDKHSGKDVILPEDRRFESTLVVGVSGSGKTSLIFEPMICRDIEKKNFFKKTAKEYGFAALKSGIASINAPYDNDYINDNFSLNMISANPNKSGTYNSCMSKMIRGNQDGKIIYKDIGLTYISPDFESVSRVLNVAKNYHVKVNLIDPNSRDSVGLNPFAYDNPLQASVIISTVLKNLHSSNRADLDLNLGVQANFASQAIENLSILLKVMYPKMHDGEIPTLEDMLDAFNDFSIIQSMCEQMEKDEELAEKFKILITYFKKNFYTNSTYRLDTEKYISSATTQLDNLLRYPGIRSILCNRTNNINFDAALADGQFTFLCTRRGDLGAAAHTAFGLFFILSMQYAVLRRPGIEATRNPHFLYIDEFSDFISGATEPIFTLYRKYRIGSVISVQNLDQLDAENKKYRKTIIANCAHKIVFGNNEPGDNDWWEKELGEKSEFSFSRNYETEKGSYSANLNGIKYTKTPNFKAGKVQTIKFKECIYKVRDAGGKNTVGYGKLNFIESKYKEKQQETKFNFTKFTNGMSDTDEESKKKRLKKSSIPTFVNDDDTDEELDPIRTNGVDSIFGNPESGTAIINNPHKKNNNSNN